MNIVFVQGVSESTDDVFNVKMNWHSQTGLLTWFDAFEVKHDV